MGQTDKEPSSLNADDGFDAALDAETLFEIAEGAQPCEDETLMREARRYVCLHMRYQGFDYRSIAAHLKISVGLAHKLVKKGLKKHISDKVDDVRELQLERLNRLLAGVMDKAEGGDITAVGPALAIMAQINAMYGIEPPKQVSHTHTVEAVNDARAELAKALSGLPAEGDDTEGVGETTSTVH